MVYGSHWHWQTFFSVLSKYPIKIQRKTNDHLIKLGAKFCESKGEEAAILI